jgi:hypothetical protein
VDVLPEEQVAHAPAHDPAVLTGVAKARTDADRVAIDMPDERCEVDFRGHFLGLSRCSALARSDEVEG